MPNTEVEGPEAVLKVAVGVLRARNEQTRNEQTRNEQARYRYLLAQRPVHLPHGGLWEFPGGKREQGETIEQALARELREEIGIAITACKPLQIVRHDYRERKVELHVYLVTNWRGEIVGREGQALRWLSGCALRRREMPAASRHIVNKLLLPDTLLITPDRERYDDGFFLRLESLLQQGLELVQFRSRVARRDRYQVAMRRIVELCRGYRARIVLNGGIDDALAYRFDGVHLVGHALDKTGSRPVADELLLGASCHNREELCRSEALGVDYVVLSPVKPTRSHPGQAPLGWPSFRALAASRPFPIYALGGMRREDLRVATDNGAHGIAAISGLWEAR